MGHSGYYPFDEIADVYDKDFTGSLIGNAQREQVRKHLLLLIDSSAPLNILEINCGTGEDALWMSTSGNFIEATAASELMIENAKQRNNVSLTCKVNFTRCRFDQLSEHFNSNKFVIIFSNHP